MSEQTFKPGDIVLMKTGGPHMIVEGIAANGVAYCAWFTTKHKLCRDGFDILTLKSVVTVP